MDDRTAARVDRLFARLTVLYGHRFTAPIDDEALWELARQEWAAAVEALTDEQIRRGLDACKAGLREWPPAFGEFVRLALGLPDTYQAAALAAKGEGDELSRLIRRETGDAYNVRMVDSRSAQRMCERAYEGVVRGLVERVNRAEPVDPAAAITEQFYGETDETGGFRIEVRAAETRRVGDVIAESEKNLAMAGSWPGRRR